MQHQSYLLQKERSLPLNLLICKLLKQLAMKKIFLSLISICFLFVSKGQITKGNWLVGGSGTISRQQEELLGSDVKSTSIQLNPNLGYFIIDKFSIGLKPGFEHVNLKTNTYKDQTTSWAVGPFARYYFLPVNNQTNLFAETAYQYSSSSKGSSQDLFLFSAGPVIYFNSSVGLELTGNYRIDRLHNVETSAKTFFMAIGLQVHLEKEKN